MAARALMFQGTGSDVGKSLIVAGLARALTLRGLRVRPFKPQNMSNNAAVTPDGGEIGRAQALQARACRVEPSVHMNPVLLKPQSDIGAQVVVQGRVTGNARALDYQSLKPQLMSAVMDSFSRLAQDADIVLVEGAGSASEINLRRNDIANMGFAREAGVPVVLIGDIDRGGVIAQIAGTVAVIDPADRAMIKGFLVNKFRGDAALFDEGMRQIAEFSGLASYGLVPYFPALRRLPAEDAMALEARPHRDAKTESRVVIVVPLLSRIANFDDFDPLKMEPGAEVRMIPPGQPLPRDADVIVLPGSKSTLADLAQIRHEGWDIDILAHARAGGAVLGICAGYQLLGRTIEDRDGIEGPAGSQPGLGLLNVSTEMTGDKTLTRVEGVSVNGSVPILGYEMHIGRTAGPDTSRPLVRFADGRTDGATNVRGTVSGCYLHGLFSSDAFRQDWLRQLGGTASADLDYDREVDAVLDGFARHLEDHLDVDGLLELAQPQL